MDIITEILTKLRVKELLGRPIYGPLLVKLDIELNDVWCKTFATDGIKWYFNPNFIKTHKSDVVVNLMYHSMLHLALGNLIPPEGYNKDLWDLASDIECYATSRLLSLGKLPSGVESAVIPYSNKSAVEIYDSLTLEEDSVIKDLFSKIRKDKHLTVKDNNYDPLSLGSVLAEAGDGEPGPGDSGDEDTNEDNKSSSDGNCEGDKEEDSDGSEGEDSGGEGEGTEGDASDASGESSEGEPSDSSDSSQEGDSSDSQGGDPTGEGSDKDDSSSSSESDSEEGSNSESKTSPSKSSENSSSDPKLDGNENQEVTIEEDQLSKNVEPKLLDNDISSLMGEFQAQLIASANHSEDKLPGNMLRLFKEATEPKLEWREILVNTMSTIFDKSDYSFAKPSKRSYCLGKMDYILPSMGNGETIDICVSLDTSGSITDEIFRDFVTEVRSIVENYDDFKLHMWCIDTEIYNPQIFTPENVKDMDSYQFAGGGGNDFPLNWQFMEDNDIVPELFVVFSDGYPCGSWGWSEYCDTIFVIRNEHENIEAPFGTTVQMIPHDGPSRIDPHGDGYD